MSLAIFDAPIKKPCSLRIGEIVKETEETPIFSAPDRFVVLEALTLPDLAQHVVFFGLPIVWNKSANGPANHLGGGVAKHPFRCDIPGGDDTVEVLADDRIVARFDDGGQLQCVVLDSLRARQVARDLRRADDPARRVTEWGRR